MLQRPPRSESGPLAQQPHPLRSGLRVQPCRITGVNTIRCGQNQVWMVKVNEQQDPCCNLLPFRRGYTKVAGGTQNIQQKRKRTELTYPSSLNHSSLPPSLRSTHTSLPPSLRSIHTSLPPFLRSTHTSLPPSGALTHPPPIRLVTDEPQQGLAPALTLQLRSRTQGHQVEEGAALLKQ